MLQITDYLHGCSRINSKNTILVTFDATGLYNNIPHAFGLEALSCWIEKHHGSLEERFNKQFVLELARLILENNNCNLMMNFFYK